MRVLLVVHQALLVCVAFLALVAKMSIARLLGFFLLLSITVCLHEVPLEFEVRRESKAAKLAHKAHQLSMDVASLVVNHPRPRLCLEGSTPVASHKLQVTVLPVVKQPFRILKIQAADWAESRSRVKPLDVTFEEVAGKGFAAVAGDVSAS